MNSPLRPTVIPLRVLQPSAQRPSARAFFSLAFRPLYLAGTFWALCSVMLWVYFPQLLQGTMAGVFWHAHEMLWGFMATIAVAFLLTAGANWTGRTPLEGKPLAALCVLWCVARVGFLLPFEWAFVLAAGCEWLFFVVGAGALLRVIVLTRNKRNFAIPFMLLALAVIDAVYLWRVSLGHYEDLMQHFYVGLIVMALITVVIARRVIPFFAMRATQGLQVPMQQTSAWIQQAACVLAVVALGVNYAKVAAFALALAGVLALWQVWSWNPWAVRRNALLWVLYVGYAGLGLGLVLAGLQALGWALPRVFPVHTTAMAGMSVLIIGMVTRTALGHTGRALAADTTMRISYILMVAAAVLRLASAWVGASAYGNVLLYMATIAWVVALALYLWQFAPILIRPRAA